MNYWLAKSEPFVYSWDMFCQANGGMWDGVRSFAARLHLLAMRQGDWVLFYHSNEGLCVVGIAEVVREAYPDPTADDPRWVAVDLVPVRALDKPVTLQQIKADNRLSEIALIKQSRLSVMPLRPAEFDIIVGMGEDGNA